ncbi:hypothetical protein AMECASPLE_037502 [Ameca splendens]|uniref:Uncharacterized protein n=1 Tax=Ameca splendens TaxID=208324 RepID=A0ABV0Y7T0_9TELE
MTISQLDNIRNWTTLLKDSQPLLVAVLAEFCHKNMILWFKFFLPYKLIMSLLGPTAMDFNIKLRYEHFWNFQNKWHLTDFQHNSEGGRGGNRGLPSDATACIKPPPFP